LLYAIRPSIVGPHFIMSGKLVSQKPARAAAGVSSVVTGGRSVFTSAAAGGGAPGPPKAGTGRGRIPPHAAVLEVTGPGASELKKKPLKQLGLRK
jgi:hypothetical protein